MVWLLQYYSMLTTLQTHFYACKFILEHMRVHHSDSAQRTSRSELCRDTMQIDDIIQNPHLSVHCSGDSHRSSTSLCCTFSPQTLLPANQVLTDLSTARAVLRSVTISWALLPCGASVTSPGYKAASVDSSIRGHAGQRHYLSLCRHRSRQMTAVVPAGREHP
jgi:hypothetical protein